MTALQVLTLLFLPALALGCSCPVSAFPFPSERESIINSFCSTVPYPRDIFIAKVTGATCTCSDLPYDRRSFQFPPNTTYSCQSLELNDTSSETVRLETLVRTNCTVPGHNLGIITCEDLNIQTAASMPFIFYKIIFNMLIRLCCMSTPLSLRHADAHIARKSVMLSVIWCGLQNSLAKGHIYIRANSCVESRYHWTKVASDICCKEIRSCMSHLHSRMKIPIRCCYVCCMWCWFCIYNRPTVYIT